VHQKRRNSTFDNLLLAIPAFLASFLAWGCAASRTPVAKPGAAPQPAQTATKQDLFGRFNQQARAITSLNASVTMTLTAGSAYTGMIKQYHEINGFMLAQKPASVRVIGQAPVVGTNIFDMVSDSATFHIFIPSQHKFIVGPASLTRQSAKPIENMRPQHLTNAIFWNSIPDRTPVLIEEANSDTARYYVLTVVRAAGEPGSSMDAAANWEIAERIWFDRADLNVARIESYESSGRLASDVSYSGWSVFGNVNYPRQIVLSRPDSDYKLQIGIKKVTFNELVAPDRFVLKQPPGTELIDAAETSPQPLPETKPHGEK
jgi:hypothetical protein